MTKCDFCPDSVLIKGKLVCPYDGACMLSSEKIKEILKAISKTKK